MSGIVVKINAGATSKESQVSLTGQIVDIIKDSERASFGIGSDAELKRAVGKYFGKEPTDVFLHSPTTPLEDLYEKYKTKGWMEVRRVLKPTKGEILKISTKPTILANETLYNDSGVSATFTSRITETLINSVSNGWSNSSKIAADQVIKYKIGFLGTSGGGDTKFGFDRTWGKNETVTMGTTVVNENGVSVPLKPGESVKVELSANCGTMHVRVTYEAYLTGHIAVNYYPQYKEHYFHALPIEDVLKDSNKVVIVEDIKVGYYFNASVHVKNIR